MHTFPWSIVALGFFLGVRHATDPDHVAAVSTIVTRYKTVRDALLIGSLWGIGHTVTLLTVGGGIVLMGWVIPARLGLSMEFSVGVMLVVLGAINLTGMRRWVREAIAAAPDAQVINDRDHHEHGSLRWLDQHFGRIGFYDVIRPLVVGVVHGLAGSAAVALLVLGTIREPQWAMAYLFLFGLGTIAGMMLITSAIAAPFSYAATATGVNSAFRLASGVFSIAFGIFVMYEMGVASGLFTSHPQWMP
jgi:high-affinity nickel permease